MGEGQGRRAPWPPCAKTPDGRRPDPPRASGPGPLCAGKHLMGEGAPCANGGLGPLCVGKNTPWALGRDTLRGKTKLWARGRAAARAAVLGHSVQEGAQSARGGGPGLLCVGKRAMGKKHAMGEWQGAAAALGHSA
eukprot:6605436-Pyramimonas_sp.AAC.1